ncbi:MAG: steroid delta-isomerase [Alphaproteobacteria bacterium]|nr:steroid delta-isomerase [Alphaproteobacteria bacterium]
MINAALGAVALLTPTPEQLAQAQLDAYNARDLEAFVAQYSEDVEVYTYPGVLTLSGRADFTARYRSRFETEGLRAEVTHRAVLGNRVIDHELAWTSGPGQPPVEVVVIYTVEDGLIARVEFVSGSSE